jgi:hypothetical protein
MTFNDQTSVLWGVCVIVAGALACSSPAAPSAPGVQMHNTMNASGDKRILELRYSYAAPSNAFSEIYDDFTSATTTNVQAIAWQGVYCDQRFLVPLAVPQPAARSFRVAVFPDLNDSPPVLTTTPIAQFTLSPADAHEELEFSFVSNDAVTCGSKYPASFAYYKYSAMLPAPVQVSAGVKYWLRIQAELSNTEILWGWRVGLLDNAKTVMAIGGGTRFTYATDCAFALNP